MKIKTRRYYIYYFLKIALFLMSRVPLQVSLFFAGMLGNLGFYLLPKYRDIAVRNLGEAFAGDTKKCEEITKKLFANLAKNGAEWIKLYAIKPKDIFKIVTEFENIEYLKEAVAKGRGVIGLSFHFGNWELLAICLKQMGYEGSVVARRIYFYKYNDLLVKMRARFGLGTIYRD
ncbi:MAG: hypothetical protein PHW46_02555, partial [Candidatus Omnitrophica bacterium]|nr:hypothetical protein [Candidatus Omnitrophota bacterium]